jgi:UDPglucose--hexose-1-phosphate uridylyltransferase
VIREETREGTRLVAENDGFVALAPFASRYPFETWIVPRRHAAHFESLDRDRARDLAVIQSRVFRALDGALDGPAYNTLLHTAPFTLGEAPHFHWHIEVTPRLLVPSGFEWGTGFHVNPVRPEDAAAALREALT